MEFGLREWMILIGGLLILAVIADGVRRMLVDRRNVLRMNLNNQNIPEDDELYNPELPNGGARAIHRDGRSEPSIGEPLDDPEPELEPITAVEPPPAPAAPAIEPAVAAAEPTPVSREDVVDVLVINVLSRDNNGFNGADLLEVLLACDLRYGEMDIFHRFEDAQGQGNIQFSVANLVKPGTFDLNTIKQFYTPGVSLFMQLPGPQNALRAFDYMVETANCLVNNLQGEMRDEGRSVFTGQTLEHYRQRIREFERKRLAQANRSA